MGNLTEAAVWTGDGVRVRRRGAWLGVLLCLGFALVQGAGGQQAAVTLPPGTEALQNADAEQTTRLFGLQGKVSRLRVLQGQRPAEETPSLEEITVRQELLEAILADTLEIDGVLAELANEQGAMGVLRASLQDRRDKKVRHLTTAALLTGSGVGAGVSATQFSGLGSTTSNVGDGVGIGSGAASTVLSVMAARAQHGPSGTIGEAPNMLAPLLGGTPMLNTGYPPAVLEYLRAVPSGEGGSRGTRLQQLEASWDRAGRLSATDAAARSKKLPALTTSNNAAVTVSIDDLTDRIAMLGDVRGRVGLIQRDFGRLMRMYMRTQTGE